MEERIKSNLIIIGGAEDKEGDKNILKEVCSHIDKDKDELLIATVASGVPEELGDQYKYIFSGLGVRNISILNVKERKDAYDDYHVNLISRASIVFFTGGDQLRITSLIGGTPLYRMMKKRWKYNIWRSSWGIISRRGRNECNNYSKRNHGEKTFRGGIEREQ